MKPDFGDPEFRRRLAKLLAMLSTENPAEAEAARHKLRAHLATRQLSMIDLAQHLSGAESDPAGEGLARETERLRAVNQALERAVRRSRAEALAALQRATAAERELGRRRRRFSGRNAAAGWVAAFALLVLAAGAGAAGWTWLHAPMLRAVPPAPQRLATVGPARSPAVPPPAAPAGANRPVFSWQPEAAPSPGITARAAFVRIDGTALRERPSPDAALRALLPRGLPVVVMLTSRHSGQKWSLVQTPQGVGYVDATAIGSAQ